MGIRPVHGAVQKLGHAQGTVSTRFGNASVSWHKEDSSFVLEATVPPGSTASLSIPLLQGNPADATVAEGGSDVWKDGRYIAGRPGISGAVIDRRVSKVAI